MKPKILALLFSATTCLISFADSPRYLTITAHGSGGSNQVAIAESEAAEVISFEDGQNTQLARFTVNKNDTTVAYTSFSYHSATVAKPVLLQGPATFTLTSSGADTFLTLKITPSSYDPNKTLIVPPGTNQVYVTLETSTNLASWSDSPNGYFGSPTTAQFFRIRMDKAPH